MEFLKKIGSWADELFFKSVDSVEEVSESSKRQWKIHQKNKLLKSKEESGQKRINEII